MKIASVFKNMISVTDTPNYAAVLLLTGTRWHRTTWYPSVQWYPGVLLGASYISQSHHSVLLLRTCLSKRALSPLGSAWKLMPARWLPWLHQQLHQSVDSAKQAFLQWRDLDEEHTKTIMRINITLFSQVQCFSMVDSQCIAPPMTSSGVSNCRSIFWIRCSAPPPPPPPGSTPLDKLGEVHFRSAWCMVGKSQHLLIQYAA